MLNKIIAMCYTKIKHVLLQLAFTSQRDVYKNLSTTIKKNIFFYNI